MSVSLQVIGCLGGASRQAVSKSGNPRRWLDTRVRRMLVPNNREWSYRYGAIPAHARQYADNAIDHVRVRLEDLPSTGRGRPVKRSPVELATWLGVLPRVDDSLTDVFERYLKHVIKALAALYKTTPKRMRWYKLRRYLDRWLPRWVNRTSKAPPSWALALQALKTSAY